VGKGTDTLYCLSETHLVSENATFVSHEYANIHNEWYKDEWLVLRCDGFCDSRLGGNVWAQDYRPVVVT